MVIEIYDAETGDYIDKYETLLAAAIDMYLTDKFLRKKLKKGNGTCVIRGTKYVRKD